MSYGSLEYLDYLESLEFLEFLEEQTKRMAGNSPAILYPKAIGNATQGVCRIISSTAYLESICSQVL